MENITTRQRRIIEFIRETVHARGYPPTVREIGEAVGLTSSSSAHAQPAHLEPPGPAEDEATVKRFHRQGDRVVLVPENPAMEPFDLPDGGGVLGRVVAVLRKL